jgi:hypothetical protein
LAEYEHVLTTEPGQFRSIYGAARVAAHADHDAKAKAYYRQLSAPTGEADTDRPELAEARTYLAR